MRAVAIYYFPNGSISRVSNVQNSDMATPPLSDEGGMILLPDVPPGFQIAEHYILSGQLTEKQPFSLQTTNPQITADGVDECAIGNIPAGATVQWPDGQTDEVTDGEVRFSVDLAGTYTLKFSAIAYLDQEVTIEAVPAA